MPESSDSVVARTPIPEEYDRLFDVIHEAVAEVVRQSAEAAEALRALGNSFRMAVEQDIATAVTATLIDEGLAVPLSMCTHGWRGDGGGCGNFAIVGTELCMKHTGE